MSFALSNYQPAVFEHEMLCTFRTFFFPIRVFFHGHWQLTGQQGKGGWLLTGQQGKGGWQLIGQLGKVGWQLTGQQGKGGEAGEAGEAGEGRGTILFQSTTSTRSRTLRHLFATLHVRWLSHIFNRNACIYQIATRWGLPSYWITIWLIDDVILIFVYLHVELILGFVTSIWHEKLELASTIILVLQANQLTKCASHPNTFHTFTFNNFTPIPSIPFVPFIQFF